MYSKADLAGKLVSELKDLAKELNIPNATAMRKSEIVDAIAALGGGGGEAATPAASKEGADEQPKRRRRSNDGSNNGGAELKFDESTPTGPSESTESKEGASVAE